MRQSTVTWSPSCSAEERQENEGCSEEETMSFSTLATMDSAHSFLFSEAPPSLEVVPNTYMNESDGLMRSIIHRKKSQKYGSPQGDSINTRHVSGKKIDKTHAQFAVSAGMMLGVRESVGGVSGASSDDVEFDSDDMASLAAECARNEKYKFPSGTCFLSSNVALPYRYKFKAYAPSIFSKIRSTVGVEKQRFLHSICGKDSFIEFISNAKSGQFFFYSHDGRYMIKTQSDEEKAFLLKILPKYYLHIKQNPQSFITHFYGMYRVKIPALNKVTHFVIMKSVFNTEKEIHKIWDLKGSTAGRRAKRGDSVHKDLDIVDEGRKLYVNPGVKKSILNQLRKDTKFLAEMEIMDYSLLLGVHLCTACTAEDSKSIKTVNSDISSTSQERNRRDLLMRTNTPMRRQHRQSMMAKGDAFNEGIETFIQNIEFTYSNNSTGSDDSDDDSSCDGRDIASQESKGTIQSLTDGLISSTTRSLSQWFGSTSPAEEEEQEPYSFREDNGIASYNGTVDSSPQELYFAGIIDILQHYNARKWGETMMRRAAGNSESSISCVKPETYASRFVDFIETLVE